MRASGRVDNLVTKLVVLKVRQSQSPRATFAAYVLKIFGVHWEPSSVGDRLVLPHASSGSVVHRRCSIGSDVTIFQGVTVGRATPWLPWKPGDGVVIEDHVILGANSSVLYRDGVMLTVGEGTVVGSNSVLACSTGAWEVWAGNPAKRVGTRSRQDE